MCAHAEVYMAHFILYDAELLSNLKYEQIAGERIPLYYLRQFIFIPENGDIE